MVLSFGSKGAEVIRLQQLLGITPDGIFGHETKKAVQALQQANGLISDGIVGARTWDALVKKAGTRPGNNFSRIVAVVIDALEGGYYHPAMLQDGRMKTSKPALYATSGETMFGLDRTAGHDLFYSTPRRSNSVTEDLRLIEAGSYNYKNEASRDFWQSIDAANAKEKWSWNYRGGALEGKLKALTGAIMQPFYEKLASQYLGESRTYVERDPRLVFHFAYACWNGAGWFQKFAGDIRKAVAAGNTAPDALAAVALRSRLEEGLKPGSAPNKLIAQGGNKIAELFPKLTSMV